MKASKLEKEKLLELHKSFNDLKPRLINYIGRRLNQGVNTGIIKKGFYSTEGLLDDIYLLAFDDLQRDPLNFNPKNALLNNAIDKLNEIFETGTIFNQNVPAEKLLEQEMIELRENFTIDADGDIIPEEELTDISYHLKDNEDKVLLIDDQTSKEINEDLEKYDSALLEDKRFKKTGTITKTIVELALFGELSSTEIAEVLNVNVEDIKFIFDQFKI